MMSINGRPALTVDVVENGVVVNCIPSEQGVTGKQYVFTNAEDLAEFTTTWYSCCPVSDTPVIQGSNSDFSKD